ncbi:hypothetical protein Psch_04113 [Pelotomaculum schinkii]|uniref:DUF4258 domain-containing protein n=1 Tax=Pelotomaculum schinkii TaxID=78350 RepID=A0A4Y7R6K1_9FIRM|nr:DUF4258 domain-containing protein [Pelotomaculum schinkii]TEB04386.1 hypothetical protein Psch_04113 [Pelotomaculum schinkii]
MSVQIPLLYMWDDTLDILKIRDKILKGEWVLSRHARIRAGQRCIRDFDLVIAIANGEIIEDYPEDQRGHSCLVLGHTKDGQPVHSVCAFDPSGTFVIITAYFPEPPKWKDPKTRGVN